MRIAERLVDGVGDYHTSLEDDIYKTVTEPDSRVSLQRLTGQYTVAGLPMEAAAWSVLSQHFKYLCQQAIKGQFD